MLFPRVTFAKSPSRASAPRTLTPPPLLLPVPAALSLSPVPRLRLSPSLLPAFLPPSPPLLLPASARSLGSGSSAGQGSEGGGRVPAGHGDGGQPPTMSTRRGGPALPHPRSATVGFAPAVATLIPCLATALLSSLVARIMSTRRGGPAPPGRLRPGGAPYGGGHAPPGSCGGALLQPCPSSMHYGRCKLRWWWPRPPPARKFCVRLVVWQSEGCRCWRLRLLWSQPRRSGRRRARCRRGRGEVEGALCVCAGFTAARCSQAQQHAGEVKAAWEFENIVTLAATSQREGVAFQRWDIHGVRPRSTAAGASSAGTVDGGSGPLSSWQKYQPLPHR